MSGLDFKIDLVIVALFMLSILVNSVPKKYKGWFWDFVRNNYHKHILLGGLYGMVLSTTFSGVPILVALFITLFTTGVLCTTWEWAWGALNGSKVDYNDVYYGVAASALAVICHL